MSDDIKAGDLAMTVRLRPCCGGGTLGYVLAVRSAPFVAKSECLECGKITEALVVTVDGVGDEFVIEASRLKKIAPPAEGDSLPTRHDLEVTA